jgi:two-component system, sensor histidine kinase YesM
VGTIQLFRRRKKATKYRGMLFIMHLQYSSGITFKNSIFGKMLLAFFVIIIPFYIIGINISNWGIRTVSNEIKNSIISKNNFYMSNLENEIQRIKILQSSYLNSENLISLAYAYDIMDNITKTETIKNLKSELGFIKSSSMYIHDVKAYIPSIDKCISANVLVNREVKEDYDQKAIMIDLLKEYMENSSKYLIQIDEKYVIISVPHINIDIENPPYFIVVELSNDAFKRTVDNFSSNDYSGAALIDMNTRSIIAGSKDYDAVNKIYEKTVGEYSSNIVNECSVNVNNKPCIGISYKSSLLNMAMINYIHKDILFSTVNRYRTALWIFTGGSLIVLFLLSFIVYKLVQEPLRKLLYAFSQVEEEKLEIKLDYKRNDEFRYIFLRFNSMVKNLNELIGQVYRQKILMQKAELKKLQSQINPHFLYNSFFSLYSIAIAEGNTTTAQFCNQLGRYFKYITRNINDEELLEKEVEYARIYSDIQGLRFSNRISVQYNEIPGEFRQLKVPRLIIQPLLENAFEHGLKDKKKDGVISINFENLNGNLCVKVEDNGDEITESQIKEMNEKILDENYTQEVTGIINIHRRIRLKFGTGSGITIKRGMMGGLEVCLYIEIQDDNKLQ